LLTSSGMAATLSPASAASTVTNFSYTGSAQSWTVPAGITSIQVRVIGASGGTSWSQVGGYGESITATLSVTPLETLNIYVGQQGSGHSNGVNASAFNGGGAGFYYGAGGGGASDIRRGGSALSNRVIVAGGGGGSGSGAAGGNAGLTNGARGTDSSGGSGLIGFGGNGGSQVSGGTGGAGGSMCGNLSGGNGSLGVGGDGAATSAGGGGGGGGYYGGGGGGSGCNSSGGGGGSSYTHPTLVTSVIASLNTTSSHGSIQITYSVTTLATVGAELLSGGRTATYGTYSTIRVTVSSAGKITILANRKRIPGCINRNVSSTFDCPWKPSNRGAISIQVKYTNTSGTEISADSANILFNVVGRSVAR
jgi:hypothetical protein